MTPLVVDASALAEYLLGTARAGAVQGAIARADAHTPTLCDVEIVAILRRAVRGGRLNLERAAEVVIDLVDLPLTRHAHLALIGRMLQLRENFTAYDATYVALAESLGADLLTADARLARATTAHTRLAVIDASRKA